MKNNRVYKSNQLLMVFYCEVTVLNNILEVTMFVINNNYLLIRFKMFAILWCIRVDLWYQYCLKLIK